jgi:hypothetical protein
MRPITFPYETPPTGPSGSGTCATGSRVVRLTLAASGNGPWLPGPDDGLHRALRRRAYSNGTHSRVTPNTYVTQQAVGTLYGGLTLGPPPRRRS